jgi:phage tail sheath protein FI
MATSYLVPGVYVEERLSGARPIEPVGTSLPGFIGVANGDNAAVNVPVAVNNWSQFREVFCRDSGEGTPLAFAVYGFFQNGGDRCYVVNVGPKGTVIGDGKGPGGVTLLEGIDEVAIVACPGFTDPASYDSMLSHCELMTDRVAILDAPPDVHDTRRLTTVGAARRTTPAPTPAGPAGGAPGTAAGPVPRPARAGGEGGGGAGAGEVEGVKPRQSDNGFGAFYYPWIRIRNPFSPRETVEVPPSGHMAGIYARTDGTRGVHKAPANELIRGALDVTHRVTTGEQKDLNPQGVNCIRFFPREGIRVWGARTLAPSASEWRYLNVRRLMCMAEKSIRVSTRWMVFEPNDERLWKSIRRDISAFLSLLWRQGALMGNAPEDAFFVQCDSETNPTEVIDAGMVRTVIGVAPVKPAEFVVFEIGQTAAGADVTVGAA